MNWASLLGGGSGGGDSSMGKSSAASIFGDMSFGGQPSTSAGAWADFLPAIVVIAVIGLFFFAFSRNK